MYSFKNAMKGVLALILCGINVVTCANAINYAVQNHEGFVIACAIVSLCTVGYGAYRIFKSGLWK